MVTEADKEAIAMADVLKFTGENFKSEVLDSGIPVLVDFWAPWCGPCQMMAPEFEAAAKTMKGKFKFGKVNIDDASPVAMRFDVMSIPTIILFKDGKVSGKNSGWLSSDGITDLIKESF